MFKSPQSNNGMQPTATSVDLIYRWHGAAADAER
jgi:hypothetical protein